MLGWSQKFLGIQRLDARSPVGHHFLIVVIVVPYSSYLPNSLVLMSIHKWGVGRIYSQSRGRGRRKRLTSCFASPMKNPGGAIAAFKKFVTQRPPDWFLMSRYTSSKQGVYTVVEETLLYSKQLSKLWRERY